MLMFQYAGTFSQTEFTLETNEAATADASQNLDSTLQKPNKNDVFLELGGASAVYSLNYQRKLVSFGQFDLKGRFGYSTMTFPDLGFDHWIIFGGSVSYNIDKHHSFNIGGGQVYYTYEVFDFFESTGTKRNSEYYTYMDLSYRYSFKKNWFIQAGITPVILYNEPGEETAILDYWGGISVGYSF